MNDDGCQTESQDLPESDEREEEQEAAAWMEELSTIPRARKTAMRPPAGERRWRMPPMGRLNRNRGVFGALAIRDRLHRRILSGRVSNRDLASLTLALTKIEDTLRELRGKPRLGTLRPRPPKAHRPAGYDAPLGLASKPPTAAPTAAPPPAAPPATPPAERVGRRRAERAAAHARALRREAELVRLGRLREKESLSQAEPSPRPPAGEGPDQISSDLRGGPCNPPQPL